MHKLIFATSSNETTAPDVSLIIGAAMILVGIGIISAIAVSILKQNRKDRSPGD
jgi:predicted permease